MASKTSSLTLSFVNLALLATVCGCGNSPTGTAKLSSDMQTEDDAPATSDTPATPAPVVPNPVTITRCTGQLPAQPVITELSVQPTISTAAMTSRVVPGAYACPITTDAAGQLVTACASAVASVVGVNEIPYGQNIELFVEKWAADSSLVFHTPVPGVAPRAVAAAASGDTYVIGALEPVVNDDEAFRLIRLSPSGSIVWSNKFYKLLDGTAAEATLTVAKDGTVWVTGSTNFIAAQYDDAGNELQRIPFPQNITDHWGAGETIVVLENGDLLVAGSFQTAMDFGGGQLGDSKNTMSSGFLARYTSSGQYVMSQTFSENTGVGNVKLTPTSDGGFVMTAPLNGKSQAFGCAIPDTVMAPSFVAKLNPSFVAEWVTFAPMGIGPAVVDNQGNITAAAKSPDNVYLMTLDSSGAPLRFWSSASGFAAGWQIAANAAGTLFVSGSFGAGDVAFGPTQISTDRTSAFLLTIEP